MSDIGVGTFLEALKTSSCGTLHKGSVYQVQKIYNEPGMFDPCVDCGNTDEGFELFGIQKPLPEGAWCVCEFKPTDEPGGDLMTLFGVRPQTRAKPRVCEPA